MHLCDGVEGECGWGQPAFFDFRIPEEAQAGCPQSVGFSIFWGQIAEDAQARDEHPNQQPVPSHPSLKSIHWVIGQQPSTMQLVKPKLSKMQEQTGIRSPMMLTDKKQSR